MEPSSWGSGLLNLLGAAGNLRYGVPTEEKERLAITRGLPGAPIDNTADQDVANRYAAGFLFGRQHPTIAPMIQPWIDRVKTSDLPFFGGSSPELQSYASQGVRQGAQDSFGVPW